MGRNRLVKKLVLLFLGITFVVSIVILIINLYGINILEIQEFSTQKYLGNRPHNTVKYAQKDPELLELEVKIGYILKLYRDGNQPNLDVDIGDIMNDGDYKKEVKIVNQVAHNLNDTDGILSTNKQIKWKFETARTKQHEEQILEKKYSSSVPGVLNVHIWEGWCGPRVEDLKRDKHFPLYPSFKTNISLFFSQWNEAGYGERIFGYLHPPETGKYTFAVSCDDNCEIWLSNSSDPKYSEKIAHVGTLNEPANTKLANFRQYKSQISKQVSLVHGEKYYIEALHKQAAYKDHLLLTWLAPSWQRIRTISSKFISSFISDDKENLSVTDYSQYIPETKATIRGKIYNNIGNIYYFNRTKYKFGSDNGRDWNSSTNLVRSTDFENILSHMDHKPSYVIDFVPKRYEGVKLIHENSVYPNDNTALIHMYPYEDCITHRQNYPHLKELLNTNSLKSIKDEENWFLHLNYMEKYDYLTKLYSKKIKNDIYQNFRRKNKNEKHTVNNYFKSNNKVIKNDNNLQANYISPREGKGTILKSNKGKGNDNIKGMLKQIQSRDIRKPRVISAAKHKVNNNIDSFIYKRRKLLSFIKDESNITSDTQKVNINYNKLSRIDHRLIKSKNSHSERQQRRTENTVNNDNKYVKLDWRSNLNNDDLPNHYEDNNGRSMQITIPKFVKSSHTSNKTVYTSKLYRKNTGKPFIASSNNKKYSTKSKRIKRIFPRRRAKILPPIFNKIYFKDGVYKNGSNTTTPDQTQMTYLYNIFGSAIYHLSQVPERHFQWMYNYILSDCKTDGNLQLSEEIAKSVVDEYMNSVQLKHGEKYTLRNIVNVEENHDVVYGDRYLIELDLNVEGQRKPQHLSRYVYKPVGSSKLFEIKDFQWNPYATVHIIIPVKDQGRWVKHFINNMEDICNDPYLNVIIVDFNSTDIDIKKSLRASKIKRYQVVSLDGPFQRALGVQAGAEAVKNPNDIIFACDLHLEIPFHLVRSIRKHTIKGKMAFAPMVFRLSCGYTPELPYGLWEIQGYGLFAISKYDFERIGGMNTKEFKTKWGGEDWEFLDRTLANGLEVERMRIPNFYHYYHSKKRMWVAPKSTLPPMANMDLL